MNVRGIAGLFVVAVSLGTSRVAESQSQPSIAVVHGRCEVRGDFPTDQVLLVDAAAAGEHCDLPRAATLRGKRVTVKKTDSSDAAVIIEAASGETIDGRRSALLSQSLQFVTVLSDGRTWHVVDDANSLRTVFAYGARCDGQADDTSAFVEAIAATGMAYVPRGRCLVNLVITSSNVRIMGQAQSGVAPVNASLRAYDPTRPVIQIGDDRSLVSGVRIDGVAFEASASTGIGRVGVYCAGGCYENYFTGLSFNHFSQYGLWIQGGARYPASLNFFNGVRCVAAERQDACVYVSAPPEGQSYTSDIYFGQSSFTMEGHTSGQLVVVDSVADIHLSQTHLQATDRHALEIRRSTSQRPRVVAEDLTVDSTQSEDVLVHVYDVDRVLSSYIVGTVSIDGWLEYADDKRVALNNRTAPVRLIERLNRGIQAQVGSASLVGNAPIVWQSSTQIVRNTGRGETVLGSAILNANALDRDGAGVSCSAWGAFGTTPNPKTIRAYVGPQLVFSATVTARETGWYVRWDVVRTSANHQMVFGYSINGSPSAGLPIATTLRDDENLQMHLTADATTPGDVIGNRVQCVWYPERNSGGQL